MENQSAETHTLILMRHAKAGSSELTESGKVQAKEAAALTIEKGYVPDVIIHSAANRVLETATLMQETYKEIIQKDVPMVMEKVILAPLSFSIYEEDIPVLAKLFGDNSKVVLTVAHENNIQALSKFLLNEKIKPATAEMIILEQDVKNWEEFTNPTEKERLTVKLKSSLNGYGPQ